MDNELDKYEAGVVNKIGVLEAQLVGWRNEIFRAKTNAKVGKITDNERMVKQSEEEMAKAIEIYEEVIEEASEIQRIASRATYQLGLCYLKKGQKDQAAKYFQQVITNFPTQKTLARKATRQLKKITPVKYSGEYKRLINDLNLNEDYEYTTKILREMQ